MSTILAYIRTRRLPPRPCRICKTPFTPKRKRQVLCGAQACINENHRRRGVQQWQRTGGTNFNRRAPNERYKKCPCGAVIENTCGNKKYCESCRDKTIQEGKRKRAARQSATGRLVDPKGSGSCETCGSSLQFRYDFLGRSLEHCVNCGERPVPLYGKRQYDQRERLEAELRARQETVEAPVDQGARERSRGRTQHCKTLKWGKGLGDAFRQATHKRGAA